MKSKFRKLLVTFAVFVAGTVFALSASAQCGASDGHAASNAVSSVLARSVPLRFATAAAVHQSEGNTQGKPTDVSIVGFWHVTFTSEGTTNPPIPDGAIVDMGFAQWHSDGTEILNSSRPPATSNFCLGVWDKTGHFTYNLNHFALSSDLSGNLIGPANIRENVTLDASGNSYSGTFSIDQFDLSGNTLAHILGTIKATRITVDIKITDIL